MTPVDTAEARWADDGGATPAAVPETPAEAVGSAHDEADESAEERRNRESAREVAEWETAFASAKEHGTLAGLADADGANTGRNGLARAPATPLTSEGQILSYGAARNSLVAELLKDAAAHEAGHYDEIGRQFDRTERELPRGTAPQLTRLRVALSFWDDWIDARDRRWQAGGNIDKGEWPMLARRIASDLAQDRGISDARVSARFDASAEGPTEDRVQSLAARLRVV
jgi:hypothetical protein